MSQITDTTETATILKFRIGRRPPARVRNRLSMPATATARTVAVLLAVQCLFVFAFVYPGYNPKPHGLPVGVVAPTAVVGSIAAKAGSAFALTRYRTQQAARTAIDDRHVYGVVILTSSGKRLLVASAASFTVSQILRHAFSGATVVDVKPLNRDDPRGATISLLFIPLVTVSFSAVLALGMLRLRRRALLGATIAFSALGGLAIASLVHFALGALPGSYLALSAITALTILALALPIAGLQRMLGKAGLAASFLLFFVFANPASGNGTAPELLPNLWRHLSQLLPPGAGGTALRNTAYFGGAAIAQPVVVLTGFALGGALLVLGADRLHRLDPRRRAGLVVELQPGQRTARNT
jgi:hypothetical protein